ncbi:xanthine dehydrogenase family protein molybdopterin-binding subunit [Stakelama tenebrarum]|uniref:Xanthine dehydrogenase family protein molybdopterin-binding subunit n=1 Tax=Stakelama tenebrarum TaxID=2711215 RepID=A0A6G6YB33_9SPHN|nr:molybdopterin cofactor-binding domain-containing protein [Sphingosinithalassobacter tenebrarum]QIG82051.1 xanthine dehydrogenase family protein molybdopterin-binding subunit [Sphingosinithalassobacter tenebrarum]
MADKGHANRGPSRRTLLIGGGAGIGLVVAWSLWPRTYLPNLTAEPGESIFGAWIKIGTDGHVTVAVPQAELGQGVFTALPQIVADELGADWRRVGVEAAPLNPLYANPLAASTLFEVALGGLPDNWQRSHATRSSLMLTAGSTSIRQFEHPLRVAGASARAMLCKAASRRWNTDWQSCGTAGNEVVHGEARLGFGELAAEAVNETPPDPVLLRGGEENRLTGRAVPRLDVPAKVDGSLNFAGDIRLPDMVYASIRQAPPGATRLTKYDGEAADRVRGVFAKIRTEKWIAAVANNGWAAERAVEAMQPQFEYDGEPVNSDTIEAALTTALENGGSRIASQGDLSPVFRDARVVTAEYRVGLAAHAAIEPMTATAYYDNGRLSLWMPTQAPALARSAAARAAGLSEERVVLHPMMAGGSFGAKLEHDVAEQAAVLAKRVERPVQLTWPRSEDIAHDRFRPAAAARLTARLDDKGAILGWLAKIAAPATGRELASRLLGGDLVASASLALGSSDPSAVAGAVPPYAIANHAVDHHPADIGVPTGHWRSGAHSYTAFFSESFIDELAHVAGTEAHSFRMAMLGGNARLARCLNSVAQLGGWQGGVQGSGQGIACHAFRDSYIAVLAEAHIGSDKKVTVERLVAAVDCGRVINPDLVRQQIEGGLIFGMAAALGGSTGFTENLPDARRLADLHLPTLANAPDITVELIRSGSDPGGVSELAVPPVAPAIANALQASTGVRYRRLPLLSEAS